jgi:Fe-S-cluster formation regulator IscX/YfhJ
MPTAPDPPKDRHLVWREIQEIGEALEAFKAAVDPAFTMVRFARMVTLE